MQQAWSWSAAATLAVLALVGPAAAAPGDGGSDARRMYEEATAAFRLRHYTEAAEKYETAFSLRPDPVLLYDAAQSSRLAGNKPHALELYRNYVRLYPDGANVADARGHVATLSKLIEAETPPLPAAAPAPGASPAQSPQPQLPALAPAAPPESTAPPPRAPLPAAPPPSAKNAKVPILSHPVAAGDERRPLSRKASFWIAAGAAVVAIVGTTLILLATRGEEFPDPTFGTVRGN